MRIGNPSSVRGGLLVGLFTLVFLTAGAAEAGSPESGAGRLPSRRLLRPDPHGARPLDRKSRTFHDALDLMGREDSDYQIGNEWGKLPVTHETLQTKSPAFVRSALATAYLGGGTAFYLGRFNGHHMMATNHHVMPQARMCGRAVLSFPLLKVRVPCEKFYGSWQDVDITLFSIEVTDPEVEKVLAPVARNFSFSAEFYPGQELITIGFGAFKNPGQKNVMGNEDSDCKVFSGRDEFRYIDDPDRINPGDYRVWSFALGCDISHGDSGSSVVDRKTGQVLGLVWTAATPKPSRAQDSAYLDEVLRNQTSEVWSLLSYAVPARAIRDVITKTLKDIPPRDPDVEATLTSVISADGFRPGFRRR